MLSNRAVETAKGSLALRRPRMALIFSLCAFHLLIYYIRYRLRVGLIYTRRSRTIRSSIQFPDRRRIIIVSVGTIEFFFVFCFLFIHLFFLFVFIFNFYPRRTYINTHNTYVRANPIVNFYIRYRL